MVRISVIDKTSIIKTFLKTTIVLAFILFGIKFIKKSSTENSKDVTQVESQGVISYITEGLNAKNIQLSVPTAKTEILCSYMDVNLRLSYS